MLVKSVVTVSVEITHTANWSNDETLRRAQNDASREALRLLYATLSKDPSTIPFSNPKVNSILVGAE
jgi:hypothetical protein